MAGETIFALSTGPGKSGVAIVRISGAESYNVVAKITAGKKLPEFRHLVRRDLVRESGDLIDQAMIVLFAAGQSFTGEEMAEIHCHGSPAVVREVSGLLGAFDGCRPAVPGEFTQRAFQAGRMDLTEVEGLADLIAAETEQQRRQAMRLVQGEASKRADGWRDKLVHALALLEVTIDWVDEEVPEDVIPSVEDLLLSVKTELVDELGLVERTEKLRTGFEVAIVGPPNVGKSTLLNALAGREAAITSDVPGTTRDVIEVAYDLNGLPVRFLDTAGLRDSDDPVEAEGIRRAKARAQCADLRLFLWSADTGEVDSMEELRSTGDISVQTKADLCDLSGALGVSAKTGEGLDRLIDMIGDALGSRQHEYGLFATERRRVSIEKAVARIGDAHSNLRSADTEIVAEDLRLALRYLDSVIGRVDVEDVLGDIFSRFCLGK